MSSYLTSQRTRKVVTVSLTLSLALLALIFAASLQAGALALPARTVLLSTPVITQTYVIFGSGPSGNGISIDLTGSNGYGSELQVLGGGIYAGDGGHLQNLYVDGNPPPPIDIVGGCTGACEISGKAVINFNATPLPTPILYHITDFQQVESMPSRWAALTIISHQARFLLASWTPVCTTSTAMSVSEMLRGQRVS